MKIGDVITVLGPHGPVSGVVVYMEPMKSRPGWTVTLDHLSPRDPHKFIIRPEHEGENWIYGCDQKQVDSLVVANALGDVTQVAPRRLTSFRTRARVEASVKRKRGTL